MIAEAVQRASDDMKAESGSCKFRVTRGFSSSYFVVEEARNLMKIVAGPFSSKREAKSLLKRNDKSI
jgi:hypothetical protein